MRMRINRFMAWGLVTAVALASLGCDAAYLLKQSYGQAALLMQRETLEEAAADSRLSPEQKEYLGIARAAKTYAMDVLGLKRTDSYEHVIVLDREAVTYVVAGSPKDALEPYLWHFPIVGSVPYKGFFDRQDAIAERIRLENRGYDAYMRGVSAFSLLGFLPDPLYSSLLKYRESTLANIILHELSHATVYLNGQSSFNEGFATFVGNQGMLGFLATRHGSGSVEVRHAEAALRDEERFSTFLKDLALALRDLYASKATREQKLAQRESVFATAKARFALMPFETDSYAWFGKFPLNNAYLMTALTYQSNSQRFQKVYERLGRDLPRLIRFFRDEVAPAPNPEQFLDQWLAA